MKKTKIIIEITPKANEVILEYQKTYRKVHGTRPPSKADVLQLVIPSITLAVSKKIDDLNAINKQLEESKI